MSKKLILAVSLVVLFPLVVFSSQISGDPSGQQDPPAPIGSIGQTPIALTGGRTLITYMYVNGVIARSFDTGTKSWTDYKDGRRDVIYQSGAEDNPTAQFFYVDGVLDHTVGEGGEVGFGNGATDDEGRAGTGRVTYYNKYGQEIRTEGFSIREGYFQHDDDKGGTGIYIGEPEYDDKDNLLNVLVTDLSKAFEWCIKEDNVVYDDYGRLRSKDTLVPDEFGDGELKWFTNVYEYDGSRLETITNSDVDGNVQYVIYKKGNTTEKTYLNTTVVIDRTVTNVETGRMKSTYSDTKTGVENGRGEYNNCNQLITKYDMDEKVTADYIYIGAHLEQILSYPNGKAPGEEGVLTNITQFDSYGNSFVYQTNAVIEAEPDNRSAYDPWTAGTLEMVRGHLALVVDPGDVAGWSFYQMDPTMKTGETKKDEDGNYIFMLGVDDDTTQAELEGLVGKKVNLMWQYYTKSTSENTSGYSWIWLAPTSNRIVSIHLGSDSEAQVEQHGGDWDRSEQYVVIN